MQCFNSLYRGHYVKSKRKFYAHALLESLWMKKEHSLKSGPEARHPWSRTLRPETQNPGTLRLGTLRPETLGSWDLGPWDSGTGTLGHGILTPRTLVMGLWDPVTSNWPPLQQILRGHGICVENIGAWIQK